MFQTLLNRWFPPKCQGGFLILVLQENGQIFPEIHDTKILGEIYPIVQNYFENYIEVRSVTVYSLPLKFIFREVRTQKTSRHSSMIQAKESDTTTFTNLKPLLV